MPKETYELNKDEAQTLNIEELLKHNAGLTLKLQVADTEIGRLRLVIDKLEDGKLALTVKLENAENEVGRLEMVLKHRSVALEKFKRQGGK